MCPVGFAAFAARSGLGSNPWGQQTNNKENAIGRMSETDDGQKARNACTIGTQPVRPKGRRNIN
jgi:hypothetical protein